MQVFFGCKLCVLMCDLLLWAVNLNLYKKPWRRIIVKREILCVKGYVVAFIENGLRELGMSSLNDIDP